MYCSVECTLRKQGCSDAHMLWCLHAFSGGLGHVGAIPLGCPQSQGYKVMPWTAAPSCTLALTCHWHCKGKRGPFSPSRMKLRPGDALPRHSGPWTHLAVHARPPCQHPLTPCLSGKHVNPSGLPLDPRMGKLHDKDTVPGCGPRSRSLLSRHCPSNTHSTCPLQNCKGGRTVARHDKHVANRVRHPSSRRIRPASRAENHSGQPNRARSQTDHANQQSMQHNQEHPARRADPLSHTSSNSRRQFADVFPSQRSSQTKKVHDSCPETRGRVEGCTLPTPRASTPTHSHMPTCPRIES